jgi:hypothetical protein
MPEQSGEFDAALIPKDPETRRRLANFAGLTAEERLALDQWCAEQARENDARRRRGLEAHADEPMAALHTAISAEAQP